MCSVDWLSLAVVSKAHIVRHRLNACVLRLWYYLFMANYLVFSGNGRTAQGEAITFIDAPSLAALYGLLPGEYDVANASSFRGTEESLRYINLHPREDGLYRNIKTELGDNGTDYHWDTIVDADRHRKKGGKLYGINGSSS